LRVFLRTRFLPVSAMAASAIKCNDDRGSECANDWLWIYNFNASNVGWWYTEVDAKPEVKRRQRRASAFARRNP
jgi:hypothetical protein